MSLLKIATAGADVLRKESEPVNPEDIRSKEIRQFISDLKESLIDSAGVGLAAPQVFCSKRIVAVSIREGVMEEDSEIASVPMEIWINPVFKKFSDRREVGWEGCLSIPGYMGLVERPVAVELEGFDENGERRSIKAAGFYARVLQHEIDHLDGVLYVDRMKDMRSFCRDSGSYIL